ncbi:MAG: sugar phosphate isomerase/epimerase [Actinomycetota bacterium]|nr:sugar phosphate isomerase/epimerase [Actinomycetota bacterium]
MPASRVLPEMREVGLRATELGAPGFFPKSKEQVKEILESHGMALTGGFVPLVLHDPDQLAVAVENAKAAAELFAYCGGDRFVTAAVQDYSWSRPIPLDRGGMALLARGLRLIDEVCADYGVVQVLHPHVDTLVETKADVGLALELSDVMWCLDTGHLAIGGTDPLQFARDNADRIGLAHLKDVNLDIASKALSRELTLLEAVQADMFVPFGQGDVSISEIVVALENAGYQGLYVLEQDTAIMGEMPADREGPIGDVRTCLEYVGREIEPRLAGSPS